MEGLWEALVRGAPPGLDLWRMRHGLQNDTILFGLLLQLPQLLGSCFRRVQVHLETNGFEPHRHFFGNSQRSLEIQLSTDGYLDLSRGNTHRGRDRLASQLRAGR